MLASCDAAVDALEETMLRDLDAGQRAALVDSLTTAVRALGAGLPQPLR